MISGAWVAGITREQTFPGIFVFPTQLIGFVCFLSKKGQESCHGKICVRSPPCTDGALLLSTALTAQQFAPKVRIVDRIDESNLVTSRATRTLLRMRRTIWAREPQPPMTDLILVLNRDPEQQAAFDQFVASQYDSSSPNFHHWLTPDQIGSNFGPSQTDIATVSSWLTGHGFSIAEVTKDGLSIRFSGTARRWRGVSHEIHNLNAKGAAHIAT